MKKHILSVLLFIFSLACKDNKYELFVLKNPEDTGITHQMSKYRQVMVA